MAGSGVQRNPDGTFAPGQSGFLQHGGESAVSAIRDGRPFTGLAAQAEREVIEDLESAGRGALVREAAVRLHTAMRLYWGAVMSAADAGDLAKLDSYCRRFGWLATSALRAWREVRAEAETASADTTIIDLALEAARGAGDGQD